MLLFFVSTLAILYWFGYGSQKGSISDTCMYVSMCIANEIRVWRVGKAVVLGTKFQINMYVLFIIHMLRKYNNVAFQRLIYRSSTSINLLHLDITKHRIVRITYLLILQWHVHCFSFNRNNITSFFCILNGLYMHE